MDGVVLSVAYRSPPAGTSSSTTVKVNSKKASLLDTSTLYSPSEVTLASDDVAPTDLIEEGDDGDDVVLGRFVEEEEDEPEESSEEREAEERGMESRVEHTRQRGLSFDMSGSTFPVPAPRKSLSASALNREKVGGRGSSEVSKMCNVLK